MRPTGRRRSPATVPGHRRGCAPRNKGQRYPADPLRIAEIVAVMRAAGRGEYGARMRALIVILWRAGLRIHEALLLAETDLEPRRGSILVRRGKGGKRREVGMTTGAGNNSSPGATSGPASQSVRFCE
jgi:site-specific recombinase XerD